MNKKKTIAQKIIIILVLIILVAIPWPDRATDGNKDRKEVQLAVCVDGDTVRLIDDGQEKKYRMLLIDTPESTKKVEPYGLEAAEFTCNALKQAKKIEISYQKDNDQQDNYGRELVWIFVDGKLLQEEIARAGYLKKLYDNHRPFDYKEDIIEADRQAKQFKVGRYQEN